MTGSVAEAVGQSTGGAIVQMVGAPFAILADALTFARFGSSPRCAWSH
jgi:hypothetical protein